MKKLVSASLVALSLLAVPAFAGELSGLGTGGTGTRLAAPKATKVEAKVKGEEKKVETKEASKQLPRSKKK